MMVTVSAVITVGCFTCCLLLSLQHFLKHEAAEVGRSIADAPQKAASALGTAAEIGGGVLGHIRDKVGEVAGNIAGHRDIRNQQQYDENMKVSSRLLECTTLAGACSAAVVLLLLTVI